MKKAILLFIFLFILGFLINLCSPILPLMFKEKEITSAFFGPFSAAFALGSAIVGFAIAVNLAKIKINLLPLIVVFAYLQLLYIIVDNKILLLLIRLSTGTIAGTLIIVANSLINDLGRARKQLVKYLSFAVGAFGFGNACGYLVAGIFSRFSFYYPFIIGALVATIFVPFTFFINTYNEVVSKKKMNKIKAFRYWCFNFLWLASFAIITTLIPFLIVDKYAMSIMFVGFYMFICGMGGLLINLFINPLAKQKFKIAFMLFGALITALLAIILCYFVTNISVLIFLFIFFIAISFGRPLFNALLVNACKDDVLALGFSTMSMYFGNFVGALISGITYNKAFSWSLTSTISILIIVLAMSIKYKKQMR